MKKVEVNKFFVSLCLCVLVSLLGCASLKECAKGAAGISTKVLEKGRNNAVKREYAFNLDFSYNKVKEVIKFYQCYIYAQGKEKSMIAVYVSSSDTTPVGIFFQAIDADHTRIEVSSPSKYARELIAGFISDGFNNKYPDKLGAPEKIKMKI